MSAYDDFARKFLRALYLETESSGNEFHSAKSLIDKYSLDLKPHWIARIADDWEHSFFTDVTKILGGYDAWNFRISAAGARAVEQQIEAKEIIDEVLWPQTEGDLESLSARLIPASDRLVSTSDNAPLVEQLGSGVEEISAAVISSNSLPPDEKSDVVESLGLASRLIKNSKTFIVGAFRYLVLERLKKAFERSIEDALRLAIVAILSVLTLAILAVL